MITSIAIVALGVAFAIYYLNPDRPLIKDYSAFETYQFAQRPGVSFCADPSLVFTAFIKRITPENYSFTATVLSPDPARDKECSKGIKTHEGCMVEKDQPFRSLTSSEIERIKTV